MFAPPSTCLIGRNRKRIKRCIKKLPNVQMHVKGIKGKQVFYDELNLVCMDDQLLVLK